MRAKRNKTKNRIRKSTKYIYILIAIVLIVVSSYDFLRRFGTDLNLKTTNPSQEHLGFSDSTKQQKKTMLVCTNKPALPLNRLQK